MKSGHNITFKKQSTIRGWGPHTDDVGLKVDYRVNFVDYDYGQSEVNGLMLARIIKMKYLDLAKQPHRGC